MCGISAILSPSTEPLDGIFAMNALVRKRGPDDEGYAFFSGPSGAVCVFGGDDTPDNCLNAGFPYSPKEKRPERVPANSYLAMGHRRLSIVDATPSGHQPMCHSSDGAWIVYNGEVYNHVELREELKNSGYAFHSRSDTEVILAAYSKWGIGCLERFNGMFAFVLFDRKTKTLFAVRDRFGVKPLYYWAAPSGAVAFASEIKQFSCLPGWRPSVNGQAAYDFLRWGLTDHTSGTMFADARQVRCGEFMRIELDRFTAQGGGCGAAQIVKWYDLKPAPFQGGINEAGERFLDLLTDSIRIRLRADVEVGSCLSGGLDSSAIVCIAGKLLNDGGHGNSINTFSACSEHERFDERSYAQEAAKRAGSKAHYINITMDNLFRDLGEIAWTQDEPFGSTSVYAQWLVFKLGAQAGVRVLLDGQGADEQLGGYHGFFGAYLAGLFKSGRFVELAAEISRISQTHGYSARWLFKQAVARALPKFIRKPVASLLSPEPYSPDWLNMKELNASPVSPFMEHAEEEDSVRSMSIAQLTSINLQMLLRWEDRNSMAHSVESRTPFLDYRLVEFSLGLPDVMKVSGGATKVVMREGLKGVLPEKIRVRQDKMGFVTPEEIWVRQTSTAEFRNAVRDAVEASGRIINDRSMILFEKIARGEAPFSFAPWRIISFGAWVKKFL